METLILVDENDNPLGTGEKLAVHREGALHRCFSIFVFNGTDQTLLQKRAITKYHSGGLWTNTCCGHPVEGEETRDAARRRLQEEMGFDCELKTTAPGWPRVGRIGQMTRSDWSTRAGGSPSYSTTNTIFGLKSSPADVSGSSSSSPFKHPATEL